MLKWQRDYYILDVINCQVSSARHRLREAFQIDPLNSECEEKVKNSAFITHSLNNLYKLKIQRSWQIDKVLQPFQSPPGKLIRSPTYPRSLKFPLVTKKFPESQLNLWKLTKKG